ncbi:MAG: tail fiber protein [Xanthobacteraceae bacterium]
MSTPFMGQIEIFSFNFPPKGWALCNGQFLPINQNQALFSLLGTMYGGNGQTTFALPDLRGRVPLSTGPENPSLGTVAGAEAVTINTQTMAGHTHTMMADGTTAAAQQNSPGASNSTVLGVSNGVTTPTGSFTVTIYAASNPTQVLAPGVVSNTGGSQAHQNVMPYLCLNFCIALNGIFPSQN